MKAFRKILFWVHLVVGLAAGGVIAVTVFTGACMAFEKQVLAWVERDLRRVAPPSSGADRIDLDLLITRAREQTPGMTLASLTVRADPASAVVLSFGRTHTVYANPYTGELRSQGPTAWRSFFQLMLQWHRWLGVSAEARGASPAVAQGTGENGARPRALADTVSAAAGGPGMRDAVLAGAEGSRREGPGGARGITSTVVGVSACLFGLLCLSGIYLWWPRSWRWNVVRAVLVPSLRLRGKPRDWNWHNAIGLWSAPLLLIMSLTGVVMAFRPVGNAIYGAPVGAAAPGAGTTNAPTFTAPEPGMRPLGPSRLVAIAMREVPGWQEITVRTGARQRGPRGPRGGREGASGSGAMAGIALGVEGGEPGRGIGRARGGGELPSSVAVSPENHEAGAPEGRRGDGEMRGGRGNQGTAAVSLMVRESGRSVMPVQIQVHPFTGEVLRHASFPRQVSEVGWRRALRGLNRTIHTGEAGGLLGQSLAFLACLGGLVLIYTGFALSWRRFFRKRRSTAASLASSAAAPTHPAPAAEEAVAMAVAPANPTVRTLE